MAPRPRIVPVSLTVTRPEPLTLPPTISSSPVDVPEPIASLASTRVSAEFLTSSVPGPPMPEPLSGLVVERGASGPDRVQPQLPAESADSLGSSLGPEGSMDPSVGSGSGGGAYRAPHEPNTPTVPTNGHPEKYVVDLTGLGHQSRGSPPGGGDGMGALCAECEQPSGSLFPFCCTCTGSEVHRV